MAGTGKVRSIAIRMFVCVSVRISQKPPNRTFHQIFVHGRMAPSSCNVVAIRYVFPVWWMTSSFHIVALRRVTKARALNFFTKGDYIKSCQKDNESPLKGAWFCSRDPFFLRNCRLRKKFRHRTLLAGINNTDDGPPFVSPSSVDALAAIN